MSDLIITYLNKVFNIFTKLKDRNWSNKERSLVIDEVIIILISGVLAYIIVSLLPPPEKRVPIEPITFDIFLKLFPRCFRSFFEFFQALGNLFGSLSLKFRNIFGPAWDYIIFIPSKIIGLLQFIITCFIVFLKNILESLHKFFSLIFQPFTFILTIFSTIGDFLNRFFSFLFKIPGISHLLRFFQWIINDIVILITAFFTLFSKLGEILQSFNLYNFFASLKNLRLFNFIGSLFSFIFNFFKWAFKATLWRLLQVLKLSNLFSTIFINLGQFFSNIFSWLFSWLGFIPKFLQELSLKLGKLEIRFPKVAGLRDLLKGLINILKWIFIFPMFLFEKFLSFFTFTLGNLSFSGIRYWWDHLCQESGTCGDMNNNMMDKFKDMSEQLDSLKQMLAQFMQQNATNITNTINATNVFNTTNVFNATNTTST